jgi:hypothetical protein
MNKAFRLLAVAVAWPLGAAILGWIVFNTIYVEHGSILLWLAGIFVGLILGLVHVLALVARRKDA